MNFSLNIHTVTSITLGPVKEHVLSGSTYATRTLEVKTTEGTFEICLYSTHVDNDHDEPLLEVRT